MIKYVTIQNKQYDPVLVEITGVILDNAVIRQECHTYYAQTITPTVQGLVGYLNTLNKYRVKYIDTIHIAAHKRSLR